ncbi:MAG: ATP-binding cassette domain-containing protein [Ruminococcus sp.]|nr:ATP-binding cassette domain-containing protein [Ruminococcus sp.]
MRLQINDLTKRYGQKTALDGFSFEFTDGIYGLLGPNGAGKSTLMKIITQIIEPTSGEIFADGGKIEKHDREYRKLLGFMPQQQAIYPDFTLTRFLFYMAALKGLTKKQAAPQIAELIKRVNLEDHAKMKLGCFSGGMKQRALLAQALLGEPKIIILDEPTAGLDPKERISLRNLIAETAFDKIVIIATHVVPDVEFISKEVLLLKDGRIIDSGAPSDICMAIDGNVGELRLEQTQLDIIREQMKIAGLSRDGDKILARVIGSSAPVGVYHTVAPTLEDLYLYHFGE